MIIVFTSPTLPILTLVLRNCSENSREPSFSLHHSVATNTLYLLKRPPKYPSCLIRFKQQLSNVEIDRLSIYRWTQQTWSYHKEYVYTLYTYTNIAYNMFVGFLTWYWFFVEKTHTHRHIIYYVYHHI